MQQFGASVLDVGLLFETHHVAVYRYLRRNAPFIDATVLEDLVADTFERACRAASRYQERGKRVDAWLYEIAYHRLLDYQRWRRYREHADLGEIRVEDEPRYTVPFDDIGERERVAAALAHLTIPQQQVVHARYWEDRQHNQMGHLCSVEAAKSLQKRALAILRPYLEVA